MTKVYPEWQNRMPIGLQNVLMPWLSVRKLRTRLDQVKAKRDEYLAELQRRDLMEGGFAAEAETLRAETKRLREANHRLSTSLMARQMPAPADHTECQKEIEALGGVIEVLETEALRARNNVDHTECQVQIDHLQRMVEDLSELPSADGCPKLRFRLQEECQSFCDFMLVDAGQQLEPYRCPSCRQLGVPGSPKLWHARHVDPERRGKGNRDVVKMEQAAYRRARGLSHRIELPST